MIHTLEKKAKKKKKTLPVKHLDIRFDRQNLQSSHYKYLQKMKGDHDKLSKG